MDMEYHKQRVHTYGETCSLYPCEECGFQGTEIVKLKDHIEEYHRKEHYQKRIKQNLKHLNFDEDSDNEWTPKNVEESLIEEPRKLKRKRNDQAAEKSKKVKPDFICQKCEKSFSRNQTHEKFL